MEQDFFEKKVFCTTHVDHSNLLRLTEHKNTLFKKTLRTTPWSEVPTRLVQIRTYPRGTTAPHERCLAIVVLKYITANVTRNIIKQNSVNLFILLAVHNTARFRTTMVDGKACLSNLAPSMFCNNLSKTLLS